MRHGTGDGRLLLIQSLLVSICFDRKLIEIFHLVKVICEILVYQLFFHHPSHVFTFESMSTSFFSWLDPSTLMLSPLRLSLPPLCLTACWSWLEQSAEPTELRHTTVSAPQLLLLDGEGGIGNAGAATMTFRS